MMANKRMFSVDVVETDATSGHPAVHQSVEITVQPRAQRRWLR